MEAHQYFLNHVFLPGNPEMCLLLPEIESNTCPAKELKVLKDGITFLSKEGPSKKVLLAFEVFGPILTKNRGGPQHVFTLAGPKPWRGQGPSGPLGDATPGAIIDCYEYGSKERILTLIRSIFVRFSKFFFG